MGLRVCAYGNHKRSRTPKPEWQSMEKGLEQRVTALGWAIGMGRMGAILSPLVAGRLIDASWRPADLYLLFACAFVVAAVAVWLMNSHLTVRAALKPAA